jgi:hypothetical protein
MKDGSWDSLREEGRTFCRTMGLVNLTIFDHTDEEKSLTRKGPCNKMHKIF